MIEILFPFKNIFRFMPVENIIAKTLVFRWLQNDFTWKMMVGCENIMRFSQNDIAYYQLVL